MAQKWRNQGAKGAKGGGKGAKGGAPPQVLEYQFNELANGFFAELFDWNRPAASFKSGFDELLSARERVMLAYGMKAGGGASTATPAAGGQVNWKGEFYHEFSKVHGNVTKEDVSFETVEVESEGAKGPASYTSTVTCSAFEEQYQGEASPGKKQAEHMAAKAAIKGQFPQAFARLNGGGGGGKAAPQQGQKKRKAVEMEAPAADEHGAKSRLSQVSRLLLEREVKKEDVLYETEAVEGETSQFIATVTLTGHDNTVGYQGLPAGSKKLAEVAAAEAALAALADKIAPLEEEHKAKKAAKKKASLAAFMEQKKAKDEAKEAAAEN